MDKKIWLNRIVKNTEINNDDIYLSTNQCQFDKLFSELINYSRNNNQKYIDCFDNETNYLINNNIIKDFIEFCYKNSNK